ncbi:MAG TPA: hypothetical protein VLF59_00335 [Candidatus Saccharimonadales bacterium]|nr:hypothetical protein [Candidatus Saccharimonadales bacterium]
MLKVESAEPCTVGAQPHELWVQHWVSPTGTEPGRVVSDRFTLLPRANQNVRRLLGLPEMVDPIRMLDLANNNPEQARRLRAMGRPLVSSLVQICNRSTHDDTIMTPRATSRSEVIQRTVWRPQGKLQLRPALAAMTLDGEGVGRAKLADTGEIVQPVVAGPLTKHEVQHARAAHYVRLLMALPAESEAPPVYIALHPRLDNANGLAGPILEQFYTPGAQQVAQLLGVGSEQQERAG